MCFLQCKPLKGRVAKILTWRWTEPPQPEKKMEELEHTHEHHLSPKKTAVSILNKLALCEEGK